MYEILFDINYRENHIVIFVMKVTVTNSYSLA